MCPMRPAVRSTLFPYTTLFRSVAEREHRIHRRPNLAPLEQRPDILRQRVTDDALLRRGTRAQRRAHDRNAPRSEEHTSELQSHVNLVCRLLLEKNKKTTEADGG